HKVGRVAQRRGFGGLDRGRGNELGTDGDHWEAASNLCLQCVRCRRHAQPSTMQRLRVRFFLESTVGLLPVSASFGRCVGFEEGGRGKSHVRHLCSAHGSVRSLSDETASGYHVGKNRRRLDPVLIGARRSARSSFPWR
ncbi:unnamed protein product, partial [Symbiodinium sp. CCMP2456]